jgi:2-hydroxychromene-2-carboxylate isomerase
LQNVRARTAPRPRGHYPATATVIASGHAEPQTTGLDVRTQKTVTPTIEVVSDVICPWCFVGKRRLEQAIGLFGGEDEIRVRWLPFQLNPDMPPEGMDRREYRTAKFGNWERSLTLDAQITDAGKQDGISFNFTRAKRTPNTLDAHRLIWLADKWGVQDAVVEALFRGYFVEGNYLSDRTALAGIASGALRTAVFPYLTTWAGPRTVAEGLISRTCSRTSQSKSIRSVLRAA